MASKSRSKHQGSLYSQYKTEQRWAKNRRKKLEKLAKVHPNNAQITEALKNISYRRKTPTTSVWTSPTREYAQLVASITPDATKHTFKGMFSIKARAHSRGEPVWA